MQYATPQFIEEEGRIVYFLTFRQFFWLAGGGAVCFLLYFTLPIFLFIIFSILIVPFVLVMAFLKIGNQSSLKFLLTSIGFFTKTKNYTWDKKQSLFPAEVKKRPQIKMIPQAQPPISTPQASKLKEIRKMVELNK